MDVHITIAGRRIGIHPLQERLVQRQLFGGNSLVRCIGRVYVKREICAAGVNFIVQVDLQFNANHDVVPFILATISR